MIEYILEGSLIESLEDLGTYISWLSEKQQNLDDEHLAYFKKPDRSTDGHFSHIDRIKDWIYDLTVNTPAVLRIKNSKHIRSILGVEDNIKAKRKTLAMIKKEEPGNHNAIARYQDEIAAIEKNGGPGTFDELLEFIEKDQNFYPHPLSIILE